MTVTIITEMGEPISSLELAREIETRSNRVLSDDVDPESVESIQIELYHNHLPKLLKANLIEYDTDADIVSPTSNTTHLTALVQIACSIAEIV